MKSHILFFDLKSRKGETSCCQTEYSIIHLPYWIFHYSLFMNQSRWSINKFLSNFLISCQKEMNAQNMKILYNKTSSPKVCRSITAEPLDGIQWKLSHWIVLSLNHKNMPFNHLMCMWRDLGKWNALGFSNSRVLQNPLFWFNLTKFLQLGEKCALFQNILICSAKMALRS